MAINFVDEETKRTKAELSDALYGLPIDELLKIVLDCIGEADVIYFLVDTLDAEVLWEAIEDAKDE